jgi:peroxiredoxin
MNKPQQDSPLSASQLLLIIAVLATALFGFTYAGFRYVLPAPQSADLGAEAKRLWRKRSPLAVSVDVKNLLEQSKTSFVESDRCELVGRPAPNFKLMNQNDLPVSLAELNARGPVVVVFYLGYSCDHCVTQLFGIHQDRRFFDEVGAQTVAISVDSSERSRSQTRRFGGFYFPLLADTDRSTARAWGCESRPNARGETEPLHGVFVVGRQGDVIWAKIGDEPFFHNATLIKALVDDAANYADSQEAQGSATTRPGRENVRSSNKATSVSNTGVVSHN